MKNLREKLEILRHYRVPYPHVGYRDARNAAESCSKTRSVVLAGHDLGRLHGAHLVNPSSRGLHLADHAEFLGRISGDTNVVATLENELDVARIQSLRTALLGNAARRMQDTIDERVGHVKDRLE